MNTETLVANGTTAFAKVVTDTDWVRAAGFERATILRVRGMMSFTNKIDALAVAGGFVAAYVALMDEDASVPPATTVATYTDEDILWADSHNIPFVVADGSGFVYHFPIDIKAMRKMRAGQDLNFVLTNLATADIQFSGVVRALLRLGGN